MSGIAQSLRQSPPARRRYLSHLPPTAFPMSGADVWAGLSAETLGRRPIDRFRTQIAKRTGSTYCGLVSSGRAALALTLMGLKRTLDRSRVIVPAYGCPTVVQSVLRAGLEPVICDLSPQTLALDLEALKHTIDGNTLAVVPAHLYGWAHDVTDLSAVAAEHGSYVVEDAAQAFGAAWNGQMVGTWGDAGFYSFGRGKCLPAGGGGAIVAKAHCAGAIEGVVRAEAGEPPGTDIGALLRLVGYSLATRPFAWWFVVRTPLNPAYDGRDVAGLPPIRLQRLSSSLAAIGSSMLGRLDGVQAVRRRNARRLMDLLTDFAFVQVPRVSCESEPVYLRLPVLVDSQARASRLFDLLARGGIGVSRSYGVSVPELYEGAVGFKKDDHPGACRVARCLLTLPTHTYLQEADLVRIAQALDRARHMRS